MVSCTLFDSGDGSDDVNVDAVSAADEEATDDALSDVEDFEDFDVETADSSDALAEESEGISEGDDAYSEIEEFNQDMIQNELSTENIAQEEPASETPVEENAVAAQDTEYDIEAAPMDPVETPEADAVVAGASGNKITNLEYKSFDSGGTVVISATQPFTYQVREEPQFNQTIVEVADVVLADRFKLPYIAKDFGQPVATINAYQESGSTTARFVIQYKNKIRPTVEQRQNTLLVMNSSRAEGAQNYVASALGGTELETSAPEAAIVPETSSVAGKKIDIEMYGVTIKQLVQAVADDVNINAIVDEDANMIVNAKLRQVEWEEGLAAILKANGLTYERNGQILRIAKVETITAELNRNQAKLKAEADAELLTLPKIMKIIPINYGDLDSLVLQISPLLTQAEKVSVDKRSNSLVVTGYPDTIKRAEMLVKSLDIQPLQVLIEGKIIEANSEFNREFGINWNSQTTFSLGGQDGTLSSTISGSALQAPGGFNAVMNVGTFDVIGDLRALLTIFEREQKIKVLSSPKVTTVNKEKALIRQTTQVPIFTVTNVPNVGTQTAVTFQDAELLLEVTPQISFNSDMLLDIRVRRDIPGEASAGSVQLNKREANAKVIVKDGQSAVLGGIFSMDERNTEVGVPYLKDIPVLGYLFKSKVKSVFKNELVIFLNPKIMNPESMLKAVELSNGGGKTATPMLEPGDGDNLDSEIEAL